MRNISRHQAGAQIAGQKTGGQFKATERSEADGSSLNEQELPTPPGEMRSSRITTNWECPECSTTASVPLVDLQDIGTPICGECGDDMEMGGTVSFTA